MKISLFPIPLLVCDCVSHGAHCLFKENSSILHINVQLQDLWCTTTFVIKQTDVLTFCGYKESCAEFDRLPQGMSLVSASAGLVDRSQCFPDTFVWLFQLSY